MPGERPYVLSDDLASASVLTEHTFTVTEAQARLLVQVAERESATEREQRVPGSGLGPWTLLSLTLKAQLQGQLP